MTDFVDGLDSANTYGKGIAMTDDGLRERVRGLMPRAKADLTEMVAFRSVHDPSQAPPEQCDAMVDWLLGAFTEVGLRDVAAHETSDGSKAVTGFAPGPDDAPTVLLYFHHDVQPPLDDAAWDVAGVAADRTRRALVRPRRRRLQGQHRRAPRPRCAHSDPICR